MNEKDKQFTVRLEEPGDTKAVKKFALAVSALFTKLWQEIKALRPATYVRGTASSASLSMALLDPVTGQIVFLPGVRFVVPGGSDVNVGFELDVSGAIGTGIGGTVQGYTANYGSLFGTKLTAGSMANNENPQIPRYDVGFAVKRGATMEMYGTDGTGNNRAGQCRLTVGPTGRMVYVRHVSGDRWEVMGGFGTNHELVCGWRNTGWPGTSDTWGTTTAPSHPFNVYNRGGGIGSESSYTKLPMATISDAGQLTAKSIKIDDGTNTAEATKSVTLTLTGVPAATNLTFQVLEKEFNDGSRAYVLCSPTT